MDGDGSYRSQSYTPTQPGTYRWVAAYNGDADNPAAATACDDPRQRVDVGQPPSTAITTTMILDPCAALADRRSGLEGQLRAFEQALAPVLDQRNAMLLDALSVAAKAQFDAASRLGCS